MKKIILKHIDLELTNYCNLDCWMCPRKDMTRGVGFMKKELVQKLMEDLAQHDVKIARMNLHMFGETILHPDLKEILSILKRFQPQATLSFSTNASFLTLDNFKNIESLLDNLFISIDGIYEDTYKKHRGADLDGVLSNLVPIFEYRKEKIITYPKFEIRMIDMAQSQEEKEAFFDYFKFKLLETDNISIKNLESFAGSVEELKDIKKKRCPFLWEMTAIQWNGKVTTCCYDANGVNTLGDITTDNLSDIFHSKRYNEYREAYFNRTIQQLSPLCQTCLKEDYEI
jgi:MoaA/NifB/PqqE/SkfB family radical SAM enzyme